MKPWMAMPVVACLTFLAGCGSGGAPSLDPAEIPGRLARGGTNWSSHVKSEGFPGRELKEGSRFWILPETDELIRIKRGDPKLRLAWSVRPGQPPLGADDLDTVGLDFYVRTVGQFTRSAGGCRAGTKGTRTGRFRSRPARRSRTSPAKANSLCF